MSERFNIIFIAALLFSTQSYAGYQCRTTEVSISGDHYSATRYVQCWFEPDVNSLFPSNSSDSRINTGYSTFGPVNAINQDNSPQRCEDSTAHPVVIASGNKVKEEVDFVTGGEMPLSVIRYYSADGSGGIFGARWSSNLDFRLTEISETEVRIYREYGAEYKFTWSATKNKWVDSKPESVSTLRKDYFGDWILDHEGGTFEKYGADGKIKSVKNRMGVGWVFTYEDAPYRGAAAKILITHSSSRQLTLNLAYGLEGKVSSIIDPSGKTISYSYAGTVLSTVTYPGSTGTRQYHYEDSAKATRLTGISVNGVRYSQYGYLPDGKVSYSGLVNGIEKSTFTYLSNPLQTIVTNALGGTTTYDFTQVKVNGVTVKKLTGISRSGTSQCPSAMASSQYDSSTGYLTSETDWKGNRRDFTYDLRGRLLSTFADNRTHVLQWDQWYNRVSKEELWEGKPALGGSLLLTIYHDYWPTGAPGQYRLKSERRVDNRTGETRTTSYEYSLHANKLIATMTVDGPLAGTGDRIVNAYDTSGNLISVTNELGHTVSYGGYNGAGLPGYTIDANGLQTDFGYDEKGRVTQITVRADTGWRTTTTAYNGFDKPTRITTSTGSYVDFSYDAAGRLTKKSLPTVTTQGAYGSVEDTDYVDFVYDNLSNVLSQRTRHLQAGIAFDEELGKPMPYSAITEQLLARSQFDNQGNLTKEYGSNGQSLSYTYDANRNRETVTDALNRITRFTYTSDNKPKTIKDALNQVVTYDYDALGYLKSVTDARGKITSYSRNAFGDVLTVVSPDTGTTTYLYNEVGNVKSVTRADGSSVVYSYDLYGRLKTVQAGSDTNTYTYDSCSNGRGRLCAVSNSRSNISYRYNLAGQLIGQTQDSDGVSFTQSWSYDAHGRVSVADFGNGVQLKYAYDSDNRVTALQAYVGGTWKNVISGISYLPFGGSTDFSYGNGLLRDLQLDKDGRTTQLTAGAVQNLAFGYNTANELTSITNAANSTATQSFGYDAISRLQSVTSSGLGPQSFTYDANGNRESHTGTSFNDDYVPDTTSNRLPKINGSRPRQFVHNAIGNITAQSGSFGNRTYVYDGFNRLTSVTNYGGTATFGYNAWNQRVLKTWGTNKYRYVYGPNGALLGETGSGGQALESAYIYFGGEVVGFVRNNALYFVHNDQVGRPEVVTDANKTIVWRANNAAFDRAVKMSSIGTLAIGFPGQYFDSETALWYNWHRYYDSNLGRYIQSDPLGVDGGLNTYAYALNNPVDFYDPNGLDPRYRWTRVSGTNYRVQVHHPHVPGQQRHAHIETMQGQRVTELSENGGSSHGSCPDKELPKNKKLKDYLKSLGFRLNVTLFLLDMSIQAQCAGNPFDPMCGGMMLPPEDAIY